MANDGCRVDWRTTKTLVTGGASFIGSHLVESLLTLGAAVRVVDNLSSGHHDNIKTHVDGGHIDFVHADLTDPRITESAVSGMDIVFHLAADHGGRGYLDRHAVACATNLLLDAVVFKACHEARVDKVVFASSGCVYPNHLQCDPSQVVYLAEHMVGPPYEADNMYGWAKLMAEMTLRAYATEKGMQAVSCRFFTVYGRRSHESHAVTAMIARAFIQQRPYVVWGTGEQIRNWTHVSDIVAGTILAAEAIGDGSAVNLGTMERTRVIDAAREVLEYTGHRVEIQLEPDMPTGPLNRVADNSLAKALLGWEPRVTFIDGLHDTIDWYFAEKSREAVLSTLEQRLLER